MPQASPLRTACSRSRAPFMWSLSSKRWQACCRPWSLVHIWQVLWGYGKLGFLGDFPCICSSTRRGRLDCGFRSPHRKERGGGWRWLRLWSWPGRRRLVGRFQPQILLVPLRRAWKVLQEIWYQSWPVAVVVNGLSEFVDGLLVEFDN